MQTAKIVVDNLNKWDAVRFVSVASCLAYLAMGGAV
jgi:hypothetical protein